MLLILRSRLIIDDGLKWSEQKRRFKMVSLKGKKRYINRVDSNAMAIKLKRWKNDPYTIPDERTQVHLHRDIVFLST